MASTAPRIAIPPPILRAPEMRFAARDWRAFQTPAETGRWDALAEWASEPNPFHESWYLLAALRAFDPAGKVALLCLEADGQLAGLLPVVRERRYYGHPLPHWRGWQHANAFVGAPLVARGFEKLFWRHLLQWADAQGGAPLFLHLTDMPLHGVLFDALQHVLDEESRPAALVQQHARAMLQSRLCAEEYFEQSVNAKRRKEQRRREKRLAELGTLVVERCTDADGIGAWTDEFLALERSGWKGQAGSALASQEQTESLFRSTMWEAARRGRLERLTLKLDGRAIAILTSFMTPPAAFGFKTAYDEEFARFSPGLVLQRAFLEVLERPDIHWSDSCAAPDHPMIDHFWRERRAIGRVSVAIGGPVRRSLFAGVARLETGRFPKGLS